jgi:hypothetical protein
MELGLCHRDRGLRRHTGARLMSAPSRLSGLLHQHRLHLLHGEVVFMPA